MEKLDVLIKEVLCEMSKELRPSEAEAERLRARIFGAGKEAENNG